MMRKADVSFEELYNCYKVRFERFAISYIQDRSVAEDIVTERRKSCGLYSCDYST